MAFSSVATNGVPTPNDGFTLAFYLTGSGGPCLAINVGAGVMARLGWSLGDRIDVLEGSGNDAGLFKMVKVKAGGYGLSRSGGQTQAGTIRVGANKFKHHDFPKEMKPAEPATVQAFGGEALILMPDWAKAKAPTNA